MEKLYMRKLGDDSSHVVVKLYEYDGKRGRLHKESALASLQLATLETQDENGDFVVVAFKGDYSVDLFTPNTKDSAIVVRGHDAAGSGVLAGPAAEKTVKLKVADGRVVNKRFKSAIAFDKYLRSKGFTGLLPVDGDPDPVEDEVQDFEDIDIKKTYVPVGRESLEQKFDDYKREQRHLGDRREEEFGVALVPLAAKMEGVSLDQAELLPEARKLVAVDEVDAVVKVATATGDVLYVGSHKTHCNSKTDVDEVYASAASVYNRAKAQDAPDVIRHVVRCQPVFMAESLGVTGKTVVPKQCKDLGVLQMRRSHGSIVKAQARLLRL